MYLSSSWPAAAAVFTYFETYPLAVCTPFTRLAAVAIQQTDRDMTHPSANSVERLGGLETGRSRQEGGPTSVAFLGARAHTTGRS